MVVLARNDVGSFAAFCRHELGAVMTQRIVNLLENYVVTIPTFYIGI